MTSPQATPDSARVLDPTEFYYGGPTPFFALQSDQRFSYCLYVPSAHRTSETPLPLLVLMHGTQRTAERYRNDYREFAEQNDTIVLAPLFPAGIAQPGDLHGFKRLSFEGIRYDLILLDMIAEVAARFRVDADRFYLHGFSGGGQFAHRFAYLHADRLAALSIGAPGRVTRIDPDVPWWLGTADVRELFGTDVQVAALRKLPVQMIVGGEDKDTWEIAEPGIDAGGDTRIERLTTLRKNFESNGIDVQFDVVPGVAHRGLLIQPVVKNFIAGELARRP
ncbi:PHB depolymerase family esterase [Amycolatopsis sp. NPDC047767]|uniref:PHB depolymerase family esterase n=1 Tax=Amycolatopsis sp. NPDC047767 TaxID=3156765 RepID=UPI003454584C